MAFPFDRYRRLLYSFWSAAIGAELEYRLNFVLAALSSVGNFAGSLFGLSLFYHGQDRWAGWQWEEALLVLGFFTILDGVSTAVFAPNLSRIVKHIEKGTLDFVLLKPISAQFWLSVYTFSPWGLPNIALGWGLVIYGILKLNIPLDRFALACIPVCFSFIILYSLWFILGTTSIWFTKIYNITEVLRGLLEAGRFPLIAYPAAYRFFFTFIVPVAFLTTIPAQTLLGEPVTPWILGSGTLAIVLLWGSNQFWRFALRFYTSASS
ncbi:MAG: ABC transporter permease [Prochlorotrichaceae cyanobacterium]